MTEKPGTDENSATPPESGRHSLSANANRPVGPRWWSPRGGTISTFADELLPDPASKYGRDLNPRLVALDDCADKPCLVLFGEPGMGKSTELRRAFEVSRKAAQPCVFVDCRDISNDEALTQFFLSDPALLAWKAGNSELTLFIDSLDEGLLSSETLAGTIATALGPLDIERLTLRIACRTAEWPTPFEGSLRRLWGDARVEVLELAPLTQSDVETAAVEQSLNPATFLDAATNAGAGALLARPVTMNLLLAIFSRERALPARRADVYHEGMRVLSEEVNVHRRSRQRTGALSAEQRVVVAGRIAAMTVLANRAAIWTEVDRGDVPAGAVAIGELTWGTEPIDLSGDDRLSITSAAVDEALRITGLFSSGGENLLVWAHRSFAEYLAAAWAATRSLPLPQIQSLFFVSVEGGLRVPPQLRETASWFAAMSTDAFDYLLEHDPAVLVLSDVHVVDSTKRRRLVAALLDAAERHEEPSRSSRDHVLLGRLSYPEMPYDLREILTTSTTTERLEFALRLIEAGVITGLEMEIAALAMEPTTAVRVRVGAVRALGVLPDGEATLHLMNIASLPPEDDEEQRLIGFALATLWPEQIALDELIELLEPIRHNALIGQYHHFLWSLRDGFTSVEALAFLKGVDERGPASLEYAGLLEGALFRAWGDISTPEEAGVVARVLIRLVESGNHHLTSDTLRGLAAAASADSERRRMVLLQILASDDSHRRTPVTTVMVQLRELLQAADAPWALDLLTGSSARASEVDRAEQALLSLVQWVLDRSDPEAMDKLIVAMHADEGVLARFGPLQIEIVSPEAENARELQEMQDSITTRMAQDVEALAPIAARLDQHLTASASGQATAWIAIDRELTVDDGTDYWSSYFRLDVRETPGWLEVSPIERARIVDAAERYIRLVNPKTDEWIESNQYPIAVPAGFRAMRLLLEERPDCLTSLPSDAWARWAGVLLRTNAPDEAGGKTRSTLLAEAQRHAGDEVRRAILVKAAYDDRTSQTFYDLDMLGDLWDGDLAQRFLEGIQARSYSAPGAARLLEFVLARGPAVERQRALAFAMAALSGLSATDADEAERAREMAGVLLLEANRGTHGSSDQEWDRAWKLISADLETFRGIVLTVALKETAIDRLLKQLDERQMAQLFGRLEELFPHAADPPITAMKASWVTPVSAARDWRDAVLRRLESRGTEAAVRELRGLRARFAALPWLSWHIANARREVTRLGWVAVSTTELRRLGADPARRLVHDGNDLLRVIQESLDRLQRELIGDTPAAETLWDQRTKGWRPKAESVLANVVKRHLTRDLVRRGIVANREVEIRGSIAGTKGARTDVHVDAVARNVSNQYSVVTVVIEVKGAWHAETATALTTQLVDRYLYPAGEAEHGMFLVGWYDCPQWEASDRRRAQARKHRTMGKLGGLLRRQAAKVRSRGLSVEMRILDIRLETSTQ